mgnify:CR=1 FL=1
MATSYCTAFVTVPNREKADELAQKLVKRKLAACVNIVPGISSVYWWEGKVEKAEELLLLCKTRLSLVAELTEFVRKNHPYKIPEVIAIGIEDGNKDYLNWLGANAPFGKNQPST